MQQLQERAQKLQADLSLPKRNWKTGRKPRTKALPIGNVLGRQRRVKTTRTSSLTQPTASSRARYTGPVSHGGTPTSILLRRETTGLPPPSEIPPVLSLRRSKRTTQGTKPARYR